MMLNVTKYIGIPYKKRGRDLTGLDCYGLFIEIQKDIGRRVPDFDYSFEDREACIAEKKPLFKRLEKPIEGCAVVLNHDGVPRHIGVYIGENQIVHADIARGVVIDEVVALSIEGYYEVQR